MLVLVGGGSIDARTSRAFYHLNGLFNQCITFSHFYSIFKKAEIWPKYSG